MGADYRAGGPDGARANATEGLLAAPHLLWGLLSPHTHGDHSQVALSCPCQEEETILSGAQGVVRPWCLKSST